MRALAAVAALAILPTVALADDVANIIQRRCVSCHRAGQIAPFPLTTYQDVAKRPRWIQHVVQRRLMPPWNADPRYGVFANDARLTDAELATLNAWVEAGAPRATFGSLSVFDESKSLGNWNLSRAPDLVLDVPEFHLPADGILDYQHFILDPGFTEDQWIEQSQVLPGNRRVVHHTTVSVVPPKGVDANLMSLSIAGYVPGDSRVGLLPEGAAVFVPAQSKLLVTQHYVTTGKPETDQTRIGFLFADHREVTKPVVYRVASVNRQRLEIPPGKRRYVATAVMAWSENAALVSMLPHMHYRGKSVRVSARFPDGRSETLLHVPEFDFDWQLRYRLAEPRSFPGGTVIWCAFTYDNSAENPVNPDPSATVRWGEQSADEMGQVAFELMLGGDQ